MVILEIFHRNARLARGQGAGGDRPGYMAPRLREAAKLAGPQGGGSAAAWRSRRWRVAYRAGSPQDPRPHRRAAAGDRRDGGRTQDPARAPPGAPEPGQRSPGRLHQCRQIDVDARAHGQRGAGRQQAPSPSTPPCARSTRRACRALLVSDTVGSIKNLPHGLVASFVDAGRAPDAGLLLTSSTPGSRPSNASLRSPTRCCRKSAPTRCPRIRVSTRSTTSAMLRRSRMRGRAAQKPFWLHRRERAPAGRGGQAAADDRRSSSRTWSRPLLPWSAQQLRKEIYANCEALEEKGGG